MRDYLEQRKLGAVFLVAVLGPFLSGCISKQGDIAIEMPPREMVALPVADRELVALEIRLKSDDRGNLADVFFRGKRLEVKEGDKDVFDLLQRRVQELIEKPNDEKGVPRDYEAVIQTDEGLNYASVIDAITAISRYQDANGQSHPLVERTRFAPPSPAAIEPKPAPLE